MFFRLMRLMQRNPKTEIRNPKETRRPNTENRTLRTERASADSDPGFRCSFGFRISDFGFEAGSFLLLVLALFRLANANCLAVLQLAVDGFGATRDYLLVVLQPFGDFPIVVVADADLDRDHFGVVAIANEHDLNGFGRVLALLFGLRGVGAGER